MGCIHRMINALALLSLVSFTICLTLGLFVYFKHVRYVFNNKLNKIFVFLCLTLAFCWALIEFGYRSAPSYDYAYYWLKLNIAWYFVISFLLHFTLILTKNTTLLKNKITYILIYGPAIIFFVIDINTNLLLTEPIKQSWGWTYGVPQHPMIYSITSSWAALTGGFCIIICFEYLYYLKNHNKKNQIKYAIIGLLIPVTIALYTEWLLPLMNVQFPELIVPALTIGLVIIWYTTCRSSTMQIKRYEDVKIEVDKLTKQTTLM